MSYSLRRVSSPVRCKKSKTFQRSFSDDSLSFSDLGDSTRSLLSPLYGSDVENLSEGPLSEDDYTKTEASKYGPTSKSRNKGSRKTTSKEGDQSGTRKDATKKKKQDGYVCNSYSSKSEASSTSRTVKSKSSSSLKRTKSANSLHPSSERSITITLSSSSDNNLPVDLSPSKHKITWEDWVVKKALEERKELEKRLTEKQVQREQKTKLKKEKEEKEKLAELKRQEWLENKVRIEEKQMKLKQDEKELAQQREAERQKRIEEDSKMVFEAWVEKKKQEDCEQKKKREDEEKMNREQAQQRRRESQQAYENWLKSYKSKPKSNSSSSLLCNQRNCQDAIHSYPVPGYVNPQPWVHPVSKQNVKLSKKILQGPSPPLLFRDLKNRQKTSKKERKRIK